MIRLDQIRCAVCGARAMLVSVHGARCGEHIERLFPTRAVIGNEGVATEIEMETGERIRIRVQAT